MLYKDRDIRDIRYHWHSYIARGGFNEPRMIVGKLEKGGIYHWYAFLHRSRKYLKDNPNSRHVLEGFVPSELMKLITGE